MVYNPRLEEIMNELFDMRLQLQNTEGIVGTGITHASVSGIGYDYNLLVYLKDEQALSAVPSSVYGIPVAYMITGEVRIFNIIRSAVSCKKNTGNTGCTCTGVTGSFRDKNRPLQSAGSLGNVNIVSAGYCDTGTLGGFPILSDGTPVILSNNHVIAHDTPWLSIAKEGDLILQPGTLDSGDSVADTVAKLKRWLPILAKTTGKTYKVDGGYAMLESGISINPIGLCGYPINYTVPSLIGMKIKKGGRTTGCTTGTIQALDVTVDVNYCSSGSCPARFTGQIQTSSSFSAAGDSGSVVVTDDGNNNAVGLLFAGSSNGSSFLNVMSDVEEELGVSFGIPPLCDKPACNFGVSVI